MVTAVLSQGCELYVLDDTTTPAVVRRITQPVGIEGIGGQRPIIDGSSNDSTAKEKLPGLVDNGSPSFDLIYNPQDLGHQLCESMFILGSKYTKQFYFGLSDGAGQGTPPTFTGTISAGTLLLKQPKTVTPLKFARTGYVFSAWVNSFMRGAKVGDKVTVKLGLEITGSIVVGYYNTTWS
jgi:hypothetical protein